MRTIEFNGVIGDKTVKVNLTDPHPKSNYFQISIDNFHYGVILFRGGKWEVLLQKPGTLSQDDIDALIARVEKQYPNG